MHKLKGTGKRWLSGFLALIMVFTMLPTIPGLITPAKAIDATEAPDTLANYKQSFGQHFPAKDPATGEVYFPKSEFPNNNEDANARLFTFIDKNTGERYPGFCAAHEKAWHSSTTWSNPIDPLTYTGKDGAYPGCLTGVYPLIYALCHDLLRSEGIGKELEASTWILEKTGVKMGAKYTVDKQTITVKNDRDVITCLLGNGANKYGDALNEWLESHGYGIGTYWGVMGLGNQWSFRIYGSTGQMALWLAAAGKLDCSSAPYELTENDIRKIAVLDTWAWWAEYGNGKTCDVHPFSHNKGNTDKWFEDHCNVKIAQVKQIVATYNSDGYNDAWTQGMNIMLYQPSNGLDQPMIVPVNQPTGGKGYIAVKKIDAQGDRPLAGAEFTIYTDPECTVTLKDETTGNPVVLVTGEDGTAKYGEIKAQTYYAKETKAPDGYKANTSKLQATVTAANTENNPAWVNGPGGVKNKKPDDGDGVVYKVNQFNEFIGPATFSFLSLETGVEQQVDCGADGKVKLQWIYPDEPNYIKPGEYAVTELTPPPGCKKSDEVQNIKFWIEEEDGYKNGLCSGPLTFVNTQGIPLKVVKSDGNGTPLPGAVFELYQDGLLIDEFTTGDDGSFIYAGADGLGLLPGFYEVYEKEPPTGYCLPGTEEERWRKFYISEGQTDVATIELNFTNYEYPDIKIRKCQTGTLIGLPGAIFEVRIGNVDFGRVPTGEDGTVTIPYTQYAPFMDGNGDVSISVREVEAPKGFHLNPKSMEWQTKVFHKGQEMRTIDFEFEDDIVTEIEVLKLDANTGDILPGAVFALRVDGKPCGTVGPTKGGEPLVIPYSSYGYIMEEGGKDEWLFELKEIIPPDGYMISDTTWHQEVVKLGDTKKVFQFQDQKIPEIIIAKRDKETGDYLPGTTFEIKIDGTNFATQKTTGADGKIKLTWEEFGYYLTDIDKEGKGWTVTVTEIKPTTGYNKDKQESSGDYTQTQELKWGQDVMEFEFEDTSYRKIKVKKLDYDTNWPLMGATFHMQSVKLDDKEAQAYDEYLETDENGWVTFENLPNGTYHLTEETPPYGYEPEVWWPDGKKGELTIIVTSEDEPIRTFTAKNKPLSGLKIHKVDSITKQPIAGVLFKITPLPPLSGQAIEPPATDANGNVILQDLLPGTYEIEEISCPKPYICSHEKQRITIDTKHDDYTVTFENVAESMLYILKEDSTTGEPLAGAVFNIHLADGTSIGDTEPTGPNGYTSLSGLKPGSYVVKEVKAPDGHILSDEVKTFTITEEDNGRIIVLRFANDSKSDLWLRKVDFDTGVGLEGAVFKITKADGTVVKENATSDHEGFIQVTGLMPGTYMAIETKAPTGYIKDETPHPILLETGKTEVIKIQNKKPGGIAIRKVDAKTGEPLAGAKFQLYAIDDTPIGLPKTSGNDGYVRWDSLDPGFYTIKEVEAKEGYVLDTVPVKLEVGEFKTTEYVWKNTQTTTITVTKRDADTLVPLAGATFGVYDLNGKLVDTLVTDINGVATSKQLPLGHYRVVET